MTEKVLDKRVYVAKEVPFAFDSTASILMDILTSVESEGRPPFAIVGGFTRNLMADKHYNDFDISTRDPNVYRHVLLQMGLLKTPEQHEIDGIRQHDKFKNPYDMRGREFNIHWVNTDSHEGYAPNTFDFGINEFALKSDGLLYAPTFAWGQWANKQIKLNSQRDPSKFTTNMALRAIRFASLLDFNIVEGTAKLIREKFATDRLDQARLKRGCEKFIEDGVGDQAFKLMKDLGFIPTEPSLAEVIQFAEDNIKRGKTYREQNTDYHDDDMIW